MQRESIILKAYFYFLFVIIYQLKKKINYIFF